MLVAWVITFTNGVAIAQEAVAARDVISTLDGRTVENVIVAFDPQGQLKLADGSSIAAADVLGITRKVEVATNRQLPIIVHLAQGGSLFANSAQLENEQVTLNTSFGTLQLPIEAVRAIVFKPSALTEAATANIATPSNQFDIIWAEAPDGLQAASGLIRSIANGKVSGEFGGEERSVALPKVVAYIAADLGMKTPAGLALLQLADGSQFRALCGGLADQRFTVTLPGGGRAEIPWNSVASIAFTSDRLVWLSDLQPIEDLQEPLVTNPRPTRMDRSVDGNPLTLRTSAQRDPLKFEKGIGVHAYSRLVYRNNLGFDRLTALVGIDNETQGFGDCVFIVRGDGIELWSQRVRAQDDPVPVDIDISNINELSLIVEPGAQLDLADHADWCNARLLKTK